MLDGLMRNLSMDVTGVTIPENQRLIFSNVSGEMLQARYLLWIKI